MFQILSFKLVNIYRLPVSILILSHILYTHQEKYSFCFEWIYYSYKQATEYFSTVTSRVLEINKVNASSFTGELQLQPKWWFTYSCKQLKFILELRFLPNIFSISLEVVVILVLFFKCSIDFAMRPICVLVLHSTALN